MMELRELTQALDAGKPVRWKNKGYHVYWDNLPDGPAVVATFKDNGFTCALSVDEVKDCFVEKDNNGT
jgi:hypothetical protein|tara:strand:+ start:176 stop:379 length:204 start_codon:yes stop_codon:yes gene_type:complete